MCDARTDESGTRCEASQPSARVEDHEELAFIVSHPELCDETGMPTEGAFSFSQLNLKSRDTETYPHNCCGQSEGLSLERADCGQIERLRASSAAKAKTGETPMGAAIASAGELRSARLAKAATSASKKNVTIQCDEQIAFVLADGGEKNPTHAVMRFHPVTDRSIHKSIVEQILKIFEPFAAWEERCQATLPETIPEG